ncbi:MAG: GntR family transcriptional regulator [Holophagales bacterium]|nr:GntR family transcriptional regulator [Holophagales bacterium]
MEIIIDIESPVPLFSQLIEQIKRAVLDDLIRPGDALPSIRQLANDLEINNKTVAKAYRLLERDSVIQTKGYRGTFIHPDAKANSTVDLSTWVTAKLSETIEELRASGVTDSEIRIVFGEVMNRRGH